MVTLTAEQCPQASFTNRHFSHFHRLSSEFRNSLTAPCWQERAPGCLSTQP